MLNQKERVQNLPVNHRPLNIGQATPHPPPILPDHVKLLIPRSPYLEKLSEWLCGITCLSPSWLGKLCKEGFLAASGLGFEEGLD